MTAALLSAAKSVPSGANVSGPTDCSAGPWSGAAAVTGVRADAAANTMATTAMTAAPFNAFTFMYCLLAAGILLLYPRDFEAIEIRSERAQRASHANGARRRSGARESV